MNKHKLIEIILDEFSRSSINESSDPLVSKSLRFLLEDDSQDSGGEDDPIAPSDSKEDASDAPTQPAAPPRVSQPEGPLEDILPAAQTTADNDDVGLDSQGEEVDSSSQVQVKSPPEVPQETAPQAPDKNAPAVQKSSASWQPFFDWLDSQVTTEKAKNP